MGAVRGGSDPSPGRRARRWGGMASGRFWRDRARELAFVAPAVAAFALLRWADLVADTPVWVFLVAMVAAYAGAHVVGDLIADDAPQGRLWVRSGVIVLLSTVPMYLTGWGPMLVVGYVAVIADAMRTSGSRAVRPVLTWSLVGLGLGQVL